MRDVLESKPPFKSGFRISARFFCAHLYSKSQYEAVKGGNRNGLSSGLLPPFTVRKGIMKRRIVTLLLTLLTILSLLPTAAMAAESTGVSGNL